MKTGPNFLTPGARKTFNRLRLAFIKALNLQYFDLECYIWIETNALGYAIGDLLSKLASRTRADEIVIKTNLGQCHLIKFFLMKIIQAEI